MHSSLHLCLSVLYWILDGNLYGQSYGFEVSLELLYTTEFFKKAEIERAASARREKSCDYLNIT